MLPCAESHEAAIQDILGGDRRNSMGRVVKCPRCEWRGYVPFYFFHWQKEHEREGYLPPEKVDSEGMDSRPIEGGPKQESHETREVKVHNVSRGHSLSSRKR